jgi:hypothetical protein
LLSELIKQLLTIKLVGTTAGGSHPAHIHENNVATSGNIIAGLNPVNGDNGKNTSGNFVGGAAVTYTQFLTQNAYVNVHLSTGAMVTIVAQGNIGSNVSSVESKRMQSLILEPQLMCLWRGITDECSNLTT